MDDEWGELSNFARQTAAASKAQLSSLPKPYLSSVTLSRTIFLVISAVQSWPVDNLDLPEQSSGCASWWRKPV